MQIRSYTHKLIGRYQYTVWYLTAASWTCCMISVFVKHYSCGLNDIISNWQNSVYHLVWVELVKTVHILNHWYTTWVNRWMFLPLTPVLSCSRSWLLSALDVSVLAALRTCGQHEMLPGIRSRKCILFLHLKVLSPCGFHAIASCVTAWLLRASLLSHNELQTAEQCFPLKEPLSYYQCKMSHYMLPVLSLS